MPTLTREQITELLEPYVDGAAFRARPELPERLSAYLDLLMKWNARMNLTAIREPEEIVGRHFGESLFAAQQIGASGTLLDFGSGAGFPGVPIQLWHPELRVTLAESQAKKAAFLRELVRSLVLACEVWEGRAEDLVAARAFDEIILRAVDEPVRALRAVLASGAADVWLLASSKAIVREARAEDVGLEVMSQMLIPLSRDSYLFRLRGGFHVEQR